MSAVDIIDGRGYILNVEFGGGKDGVDGKDGRDGVAPDLQIGTVKESEDDQPHVTISDEGDGKLSLNFDLVSGKDGQNGEDGGVFIPSVSQEGVISWIAPEGQGPIPPVSVKGETGATFTPEVSLGGEISWTNDKGLENPDTRSIKGPKGEKGDPFTIRETYASINDMNADFNNPDIPEGSFVCIASNESDPDNARMYVKGDSAYVFVTDLSGATGMRGPAGIGIGKVEFTGVETATYKEYGVYDDTDDENLLGTFNLPKGADGHQGTDGVGISSIVQTTTSHEDDGVNVVTVTLTDGNTSTFNVENGSKGSTGAQGPAGQDGQDGQDGVGIDHISVEQSTFDGQPNVVTIHLTNETSETFNVYNGNTGATGTAGILNTNNTSAATPTSESMSGNISLHKISKTGNYNDLLNKPTIPAAANDSRITIQRNGVNVNYFTLNQSSPGTVNILVPTTVAELTDASSYAKKSDLATVATSGSYSDLSNRPVIGNADLIIQSVDNATPETYTEIGKFHANAASPEYITLSKVARTGVYGDIKNTPNIRNIYTSFDNVDEIEHTQQRVFELILERKTLFRHYAENDQNIRPCPFLRFGKTPQGETPIDYIPLPESSSITLEICLSAIKLDATWGSSPDPSSDNPSSVTTEYITDKSINTIFHLYLSTSSNSSIADADDISIYSLVDNSDSSSIATTFFNSINRDPYFNTNPKISIFDCSITKGNDETYESYMSRIYDDIDEDAGDIIIVRFHPYDQQNTYKVGIAIPLKTHDTNGIDAVASINVLRCAPINHTYETTGWDIDRYDYTNG